MLEHLAKVYNDEIKKMSDSLALGSAKDHGDYKYACGIIRGWMLANGALEDLARKMEEDND